MKMKNAVLIIGLYPSLFFLVVANSFCYGQDENFEFEFGTSTTLENTLSGNSEESSTIKWINVNTVKKGWAVNDEGVLVNLGHPIGVVRSEKQYENFILHVEWMHTEPGGNSGVFAWSGANPPANPPEGKGRGR